ncbi:MAG: c-type cytochrome [Gemmatimonadetes bacterium]|nr:c-type cytochrome [Gemmatimonadota bacterium]
MRRAWLTNRAWYVVRGAWLTKGAWYVVRGAWWITLLASSAACRRADDAALPPSIAYELHVNAGGVKPAGGRLDNPFKNNAQMAKDGEQLFSSMNCDGCHGGGALGWVGPSLVDGRWRYGGADGEIFHSIFYGRQRGMPAYGGILPADAIWKIVSYLRAQPVPKNVPTQTW